MSLNKKYISPYAWFSFMYPNSWYEFDDVEGCFLFYDPIEWDGNFRISAYKQEVSYEKIEKQLFADEVKANQEAKRVEIGNKSCLYSTSLFEEEGEEFCSHRWVFAVHDMAFECTFTAFSKEKNTVAQDIITSIQVRDMNVKYAPEHIPVRLSEVYAINTAYDWVSSVIKEEYKVDFQGKLVDLPTLQKYADSGRIGRKKRKEWLAVGLALAVILTNEIEGFEWRTLIDGNREDPILLYEPTNLVVDPMKMAWSVVKTTGKVNLEETLKEVLNKLEEKGNE